MKKLCIIFAVALLLAAAAGCSYTPEKIVKYSPEDTFHGYDKKGQEVTADNQDQSVDQSVDESSGEHVENIDANIPRTHESNRNAIAVVIGNRDYRKAKPVEYAINDARSIKRYLVETMGFRPGNVYFVEDATKGDFEMYFGIKGNYQGKLFNSIKPGKSDVFVFYSGHGAPSLKNKRGYFVPVEADPQYIELGGYPLDVFYENLSKLPARSVMVVLDACFSGANIFDNVSPMVLEVKNPVINMRNGVVLSSSTGSEVSSWYNKEKHGMFTYFFLKAIHNRNADYNKDNKLTFKEVFRYISDRTDGVPYYARRINGVNQDPTIQGGDRDKVLVQY